jgi:hypothetical protein
MIFDLELIPASKRVSKRALAETLESVKPQTLSTILDATVTGLHDVDNVKLDTSTQDSGFHSVAYCVR